jgi:hypothetical protein
MGKEPSVEAVPFETVNHTALNNIVLFYDFVVVDGVLCCVRKNSPLAMLLPFLADKLWYRPFRSTSRPV